MRFQEMNECNNGPQNPAGFLGDKKVKANRKVGSPGRTRTADPVVNSHLLYRLSYRGPVFWFLLHPQGVTFVLV